MSYTRNPRTGSKKNIRTSNGPAPAAPGTVRFLTPEQYREEVLGLPPLPPEPRHWRKWVALALVCGFAIGHCTPAPADDDFWANQERADRAFDRYKEDSDRYADKLDRDERRQERDTANTLLCGPANTTSYLCRAYGDQRFDNRRRSK